MKRKPGAGFARIVMFLLFLQFLSGAKAEELWMFAEKDAAVIVDGQIFPDEAELRDAQESEISKMKNEKMDWAFRFAPNRKNLMALEGGSYAGEARNVLFEKEFPISVRSSHVRPETALTFSVYVDAPAGAVIRPSVELVPLEEKEIEKVMQKDTSQKAYVPDEAFPQEVTLTKPNQRAAAYFVTDNRFAKRTVRVKVECLNPDEVNAKAADLPAAVSLRAMQLEQSFHYPHYHYAPAPYVSTEASANTLVIRDPELLRTFPVDQGTAAFWYRNYHDSNLEMAQHGFFSMKRGWHADGFFLSSEQGMALAKRRLAFKLEQDGNWNHLAMVWDESTVKIYRNGELFAEGPRERIDWGAPFEQYFFTLGAVHPEGISAASDMDFFYIFRRAFSEAEIKRLAAKRESIFQQANERLAFAALGKRKIFFENEVDSRLLISHFQFGKEELKFQVKIGGKVCSVQAVPEKKNLLECRFLPKDLGVGEHAVVLEGFWPNGEKALTLERMISIQPALDREAFRFMSWGGSGWTKFDYYSRVGINMMNLHWGDDLKLDECTRTGLFINMRVENSRMLAEAGNDLERLEVLTRRKLEPYAEYFNWTHTLSNSEVYGSGILASLERDATWKAQASRALKEYWGADAELSFDITHAPPEIPTYRSTKEREGKEIPPEGIIDEKNPQLQTLKWFMEAGIPAYACNRVTERVVHGFPPQKENCVWSEPCMSGGMFSNFNLNLAADWAYAQDTPSFLREIKLGWARARDAKVKYMPTVTMGYWPNVEGTKDGEKIKMAVTVDELKIKAILALTSVPADSLSYFAVDCWALNEPQELEEGQKPNYVVEENAGEKYGKFVRERLVPAANLLRNAPLVTEQTPAAVLLPESTAYYCGLWWGHWHYTTAICNALTRCEIDYDILHENDLNVETLKKYRLVIFPASKIVTRKNWAELMKLCTETDTLLAVDSYCLQKYPNAVTIPDLRYEHTRRVEAVDEPIAKFVEANRERLNGTLPVKVKGEKGPVRVFMRQTEQGKAICVTNDARTSGPFNAYVESETYLPYGLAQKVNVTVRLEENAVLKDFFTGKVYAETFQDGNSGAESSAERLEKTFEFEMEGSETKILIWEKK